ncbi:membrane protein insertion efficiency factor YidD [Dethiosulfatarculus sandiegensis]|uniref:membrane protein insertion efficiency factor YidD n=1 Tax=Dethiosulfatarculus sandiegensis TaxID=1429043 RepID=UPI0009EA8B72|nr:membrane protein insertion efficiency factor YidD [Dethiosulfatarculus sandiegensis]
MAKFFIRAYQITLSGILGGQCRFYPTCSQYALDALDKYGFWRGIGKAILRILKCNPLHPGGYDPA